MEAHLQAYKRNIKIERITPVKKRKRMSMRRLSLFFLTLFMGLGWASAQTRTVTGTVISSEDNEPIIGVNVVVVGQTHIGAPTDIR